MTGSKQRAGDRGPVMVGLPRAWPPTCEACGWSGPADERGTPYVDCGGVQARHLRSPVGAEVLA